jgi:hypothetical protein
MTFSPFEMVPNLSSRLPSPSIRLTMLVFVKVVLPKVDFIDDVDKFMAGKATESVLAGLQASG